MDGAAIKFVLDVDDIGQALFNSLMAGPIERAPLKSGMAGPVIIRHAPFSSGMAGPIEPC